ncbi:MAG: helicase HerA-like domain-containing protein, partial [Candidatus Aenigmatarchaeota archaeon]
DPYNTTAANFTTQKHGVELIYDEGLGGAGNGTEIFRNGSVTLSILVNDTNSSLPVYGAKCYLWVGGTQIYYNQTNSTGHCNFLFSPNQSFAVGKTYWNAGILDDHNYLNTNSTQLNLTLRGWLHPEIQNEANYTFYRGEAAPFSALLVDEFGNPATLNDYNCTFSLNSSEIGSNTSSAGNCTLSYAAGCAGICSAVGPKSLGVSISRIGGEDYYNISESQNSSSAILMDTLSTVVTLPLDGSYHKGQNISLNASVNDSCGAVTGPTLTWYLVDRKVFSLTITESGSKARTNYPIVLPGSLFSEDYFDLSEWRLNNTRITLGGAEIPFTMYAWADSQKSVQNNSQIYMGSLSEVVFLTNLSSGGSKTYNFDLRYDHPTSYSVGYSLLNAGFDSGNFSYWETAVCSNVGCSLNITSSGTDIYANLSADDGTAALFQALPNITRASTVGIKYKAWGEFDVESYPGGFYLEAGGVACNLTPDIILNADGEGYVAMPENWTLANCTNAAFSSAGNLSVFLWDSGNGGGDPSNTNVLIDYICFLNSSGSCRNFHSGNPLTVQTDLKENLGSTSQYTIAADDEVGRRKIVAEAEKPYYSEGAGSKYFNLTGFSAVSNLTVDSEYCVLGGENVSWYICMMDSNLDLVAEVTDNFTEEGIYNYTVDFYNSTYYLGQNSTDTSGVSRHAATVGSGANYTFSCNITSREELFYNSTEPSERNVTILVDNGTTEGSLYLNVTDVGATGVALDYNYTFPVLWVLNNTGIAGMYAIEAGVPSQTGIIIPPIACPPLSGGKNCTRDFNITVTVDASAGNHTISFNVTWLNGDGSNSSVFSNITVQVSETRRVRFSEDNASLSVPITTNSSANFTLVNYGNIALEGVYFNLTGTDAAEVANWSVFSKNSTNLSKLGQDMFDITFTIPANSSYIGVYYFNVTATIPDCTGNCSSYVPFVLNVTSFDWMVSPDTNISKTVGLKEEVNRFGGVTITNLRTTPFTFNLTITPNAGTILQFLSLNQSSNATSMQVTVANLSERAVRLYYNTSVSPDTLGTYNYTLRIANTDPTKAPQYKDIPLYFEIINFTVDIISPTQTLPAGSPMGVRENDTLSIYANASIGDIPVESNMSWTVTVGGESCAQASLPSYNSTSKLWRIICPAPEIPYNPIYNDLEVTGNYSLAEVVLSDTEEDAVIYEDVLEPWFSNVTAAFVNQLSAETYLYFRVNVTDNKNISSVWAKVTYPTGANITLGTGNWTRSKISAGDFDSYNYTFRFANPDILGDYDITVYANDTEGQENSTPGWFDIYLPIQVSGNLTYPNGTAMNASFYFYRNGHGLEPLYYMNSSTVFAGPYSWTIHKRKYDIKAVLFGQEIRLFNVDFNLTENSTSSPLAFDYFPDKNADDISNMLLPDTANRQNILLALVVESQRNLTGANFTINYTSALAAGSFTESLLEVFVCADWNYTERTCDTGQFSYLAGTSGLASSNPDTAKNIFNFSSSHLSAYAIAESSYPYKWGVSPEAPEGDTTPAAGSSSSSSDDDDDVLSTVVCGNGICEIGENADNCPQDCSREFPLEVDTDLGDVRVFLGEKKTYWLSLENPYSRGINATISFSDNLKDYLNSSQKDVLVRGNSKARVNLTLLMPLNETVGTYGGYISVSAEGKKTTLPVTIRVLERAKALFNLELELLTPRIKPGGQLSFVVKLTNLGEKGEFPINLTYLVKSQETNKILNKYYNLTTLRDTSILSESLPVNLTEEGHYNIEVWANYYEKSIMDVASFEVVKPLFDSPLTVALLVLALAMAVLVGGTYIWRYYRLWKKEKEKQQRYLYPLDYNTVPKTGFKIGKFAARENYFYYDPKDLSTHIIVAGATGAGKSVAASVFAEEALDSKIPVIAFDPTSQWTGFVKPCKDKNLLSSYRKFGMSEYDIRSYPGLIYDVETPMFDLDIKKFVNPGEITVFCLSKLKPGEYDVAVKNIIARVFAEKWEESTELKVVLVFDEVHRLLEKYGGSGGYIAIEKAAREFRKWGIGVIMCSQVLADFKEAIAGNVLTEVQLNTKSLTDIEKVKTKYGKRYAERIARMGVGAGLFQYPKYNNGKPFFVEFRPTKHDPHKITEQELELYKNYTKRLDEIAAKIAVLKEKGTYVENYEIDYKLALNKLKRGNFRMSEIYISSLEKSLEKL